MKLEKGTEKKKSGARRRISYKFTVSTSTFCVELSPDLWPFET